MNLSAILVIVAPNEFDATTTQLNQLSGVETHHSDPATGRVIVTLEAPTIRDEVDGLKRIQDMQHVIMAEMVEHYFEEDPQALSSIPDDLSEGLRAVPAYLTDAAVPQDPHRDRGGEAT